MGKRDVKCKKIYVDSLRERSKLTCMIHAPGHSSEQYKFLNYFCKKFTTVGPFK